jgi:hypothetical protein
LKTKIRKNRGVISEGAQSTCSCALSEAQIASLLIANG